MSIPIEDQVESILCSVLPGDNQSPHGLETLGLAVCGLSPLAWAALRFRVLGDRSAIAVLWPALASVAVASPHRSVRRRAGLLASLVLAEDAAPPTIARLPIETVAEAMLLCSRAAYYRTVREAHLTLRARLDTWAREGMGRIAARLRN